MNWEQEPQAPIPDGGPFRPPPPFRFLLCHCQIPQDRKFTLVEFFLTFIAHILAKKSCRVMSGQVTSGDLLTPPQKSLQSRKSHSISPIDFLSSGFQRANTMHNLLISEFVYLWPEVRSHSWSVHYKPMGKIFKCALLWVNESKIPPFFQSHDGLSHLWWSRCHLLTAALGKDIWSHVRSSVVYCQ